MDSWASDFQCSYQNTTGDFRKLGESLGESADIWIDVLVPRELWGQEGTTQRCGVSTVTSLHQLGRASPPGRVATLSKVLEMKPRGHQPEGWGPGASQAVLTHQVGQLCGVLMQIAEF
jgi:hypothetical protein